MGMKRYFQAFPVVEVQRIFYSFVREDTARRWRSQAPEGFEFVVKASQIITHPPSSPRSGLAVEDAGFFRPVEPVLEAYRRSARLAEILGARVMLFQTPSSFRQSQENLENMRRFFGEIEKRLDLAWEPRGQWEEEVIRKICRDLDLVHCVDPLRSRQVWGEFGYFRLHGVGGYRYRYSDSDLQRLRRICKEGDLVLFNNAYMLEDALRFCRMTAKCP